MTRLIPASLLTLSLFTAVLASPTEDMQTVLLPPSAIDTAQSKVMAGWSWESCGTAEDLVEITSLKVSPDPPQPGQNLTVNVVGTVKKQIEEGAYAQVTVKLGLVKLLSKTFDICEEARGANATIQCPVAEDEYEVSQTVALPKEIPRAKFNVLVDSYSVDDEALTCLNIKIDFMQTLLPSWLKSN